MTVRQKTGGDVACRAVFLVAGLALVPIGLVIWSVARRGDFRSTVTTFLAMSMYVVAVAAWRRARP